MKNNVSYIITFLIIILSILFVVFAPYFCYELLHDTMKSFEMYDLSGLWTIGMWWLGFLWLGMIISGIICIGSFSSLFVLILFDMFLFINKKTGNPLVNKVNSVMAERKERKDRIKQQDGQLSVCEYDKLDGALSHE